MSVAFAKIQALRKFARACLGWCQFRSDLYNGLYNENPCWTKGHCVPRFWRIFLGRGSEDRQRRSLLPQVTNYKVIMRSSFCLYNRRIMSSRFPVEVSPWMSHQPRPYPSKSRRPFPISSDGRRLRQLFGAKANSSVGVQSNAAYARRF